MIDTGELMVFCDGPDSERPAECRTTDQAASNSGQFVVTITAHSPGLHTLHVRYNDVNVPGTIQLLPFQNRPNYCNSVYSVLSECNETYSKSC